MDVYVFILRPLLSPPIVGRVWALSSKYRTDQAGLTDWMTFLPFGLIEDISPDEENFSANI